MTNITFLGEAMLEVASNGRRHFGGDTLNSAIYLARVSAVNDLRISYASAIGTDADSDQLMKFMQQENVATSYVTRNPDKTLGHYEIRVDQFGERSFSYQREDSAARYYLSNNQCPLFDAVADNQIDYLYLSGISLAILPEADRDTLLALLSFGKTHGLKIIFDNNYRPQLWPSKQQARVYYHAMSKLADIALITINDDQELFECSEEPMSATHAISERWQVPELIIKRGKHSALYITPEKQTEVGGQTDVKPVDTSAAGDAFAAGFLAARLVNEDSSKALDFAHRLAATVIQHPGAIIEQSAMFQLMEQYA